MRKIIQRKDIAIILTVSWMLLIFYLSHQPASESSELSGSFVEVFMKIISVFPIAIDGEIVHFIIRKSAHFIAYFILGLLIFHTVRLYIARHIRAFVCALFISFIYAASDEFHQTFIPGRSGELRDVFIDSAGALTGICAYVLVIMLYNKLGSRYK